MGLGKTPVTNAPQQASHGGDLPVALALPGIQSAANTGAPPPRPQQQPTPQQKKQQQSNSAATLAERRYLWTARAFAVLASVSVCANIVLVLALFQLIPLVRVEPFLLSFQNKSEQIVTIEPIIKDMASTRKVTETLIRQYILLRNTMVGDMEEMRRRWGTTGQVRWMSDAAVYAAFVNTSVRAMQKIEQEGLTREVNILSVIRHGNSTMWQVEFDTRDMLPQSEEPTVHRWIATLKIGYVQGRVIFAERLKNPLGFQIMEYGVAAKNIN